MAIFVDERGADPGRDYPSLYFALCDCAGPQPGTENPRADEHDRECPYRAEVEVRVDTRD
jgi:hypothetical protein